MIVQSVDRESEIDQRDLVEHFGEVVRVSEFRRDVKPKILVVLDHRVAQAYELHFTFETTINKYWIKEDKKNENAQCVI